MGYYCTVPQCTSLAGKTKNVKFHRFPRDLLLADKWNIILKRGKPYTKYSKVCSLHFTQADYNVTTMGQWKTLSKDAVPSQNLPKLNPDGSVMVIRKSRTVKYRECKKEDSISEKSDKWQMPISLHNAPTAPDAIDHTDNLQYRIQTISSLIAPVKTRKQDAIMQTEPVQSEEDDSQPNNNYHEVSKSHSEADYNYQKENYESPKFEPKDYSKEDYIPQTNEEYNKEAEKYALERKSHNGFDKIGEYPKTMEYKIPEVYGFSDKFNRTEYYQNGYPDSAELLRNQQHNIQMLQEQHRIAENQNFFNENHIKQEVDISGEDDKLFYTRNKEQLDASGALVDACRQQQRLLHHLQHHHVKREPDLAGGYFEQFPRPGPELLIAKQNALAAHSQLWPNPMKRPFFYSTESPHYNSSQVLRYEDISRIQ